MDDAGKRLELTQELKRARYWILGVGIATVIFDQIYFQLEISKYDLPRDIVSELRNHAFLTEGVVLAFFIGMFILAKFKPVIGCVLALIGFWALALWAVDFDPTQLWRGIIVKILFTSALVRGIKSANRAQQLQTELGQIFE
jgi:hypothetical protein